MIKLDYPYASELNPLLYQMSKDDIEFSEASELHVNAMDKPCLLYTSPSPRDRG